MEYGRILGKFVDEPMERDEPTEIRSSQKIREGDMTRPRLGIPTSQISWLEHRDDIQKVVWKHIKSGRRIIPEGINSELRMHLEHFRNILDCYSIIAERKTFSCNELWYRCLTEGPAFATFIKESRRQTLKGAIALYGENDGQELDHGYQGYDAILHEAFLVYWKELEDPEDYLYALIPELEHYKENVNSLFIDMCKDFSAGLEEKSLYFLQPIACKKGLNNDLKPTLLKNSWNLQDGFQGNYYGRRVIVPTTPGSTRDTAIPDTGTLNALKIISSAARDISIQVPYMANCPFHLLNKRVARMRKCKVFLHIDFKKFGLTSPRKVINSIIAGLNLPELQIENFVLDKDEEPILTTRGSALGWMDPVTALGVASILHRLFKEHEWDDMDMIIFNDDVEIGFKEEYPEEAMLLRRELILAELESYGFILSYKKIYFSKVMIFLENYFIPGRGTPPEMMKNQLACKMYAKSLSTPYLWKAKILHAQAHLKVRNEQISSICYNSIRERDREEFHKPVELGGWTYMLSNTLVGSRPLNLALENADGGDLQYFFRMRRYKEPHLVPKVEYVNLELVYKRVEAKLSEAYRPSFEGIKDKLKYDLSMRLEEIEYENLQLQSEDAIKHPRPIPYLQELGRERPG